MIREQQFPKTNSVKATVIWDQWDKLSNEDRSEVILQAYEDVEGCEFREQIALSIGLTFPEACDAGLLPVQVVTALRETDPVTVEDCRDAMIRQGASVLDHPDRPALRFTTVEEAEQCVRRLVEELPESKSIWIITQEVARIVD